MKPQTIMTRRDFLKAAAFTAMISPPALAQLTLVQYVDTVNGDDANDGITQYTAKATLGAALAVLTTDDSIVGRVVIHAPSEKPVAGFVEFTKGNIILEGVGGLPWYAERTTTFVSSGWTDEGDHVYSRSDGGANADMLFVPTQIDNQGFSRVLAKNQDTPTTPAAGEFGHADGKFYVHLVGNNDPNSHTIKRHNTNYLFRASGESLVTIRNCVGRYVGGGGSGIFECNAPEARLTLQSCVGQYSAGSGVSVPVGGGEVTCVDCTMQRNKNDGYNQHGGLLTLVDCDGSYNDDEGASNHDGTTMSINGGRYHHNQAGGCTVVNDGSIMVLTNVLVDFNGAKNGRDIEKNGIVFDTGTSGSVTSCTAQNNVGSGYSCNGASVTIIDLTSGIEEGNTLDDILC